MLFYKNTYGNILGDVYDAFITLSIYMGILDGITDLGIIL